MKILVNGLLEENSGKTWITISLYNVLKNKGFRVGLYKPISGHSGWKQFNTILESVRRKILVCEDVLKYLNHTKIEYPIELINPVDFLLTPTDINIFRRISDYMMSLENQYKQGILARISNFEENSTVHYRIIDNYDKAVSSLKPWLDKLLETLNPTDISLKQLFSILLSDYLDEILNRDLEVLDKENDLILIESFNNASVPYRKIIPYIDKMLSVTPGYVIEPTINKAKKLLGEDLEKYFTSETLLSDAGIQSMMSIPPYEDINKLSRYILQNWVKYRKMVLD